MAGTCASEECAGARKLRGSGCNGVRKRSAPVCEPADPFVAGFGVGQNALESLFDVESGSGGAGEDDFCELLLEVGGDDVGPFDAVLGRIIRRLVSKTCLEATEGLYQICSAVRA